MTVGRPHGGPVPVCDLQDLHGAVLEAFRDDMRRVAAIESCGSISW